eukprot:TRINITY_DN22382_c0_g1_i1.p1 TRINITY_DN22382_c0_g1~~TRINITY_DN22382_c0_g1_i1.p1  ORF type:complete len:574 (-),score=141.64 TRINITY_DN22382_c0_g1_i1:51-1772(-)
MARKAPKPKSDDAVTMSSVDDFSTSPALRIAGQRTSPRSDAEVRAAFSDANVRRVVVGELVHGPDENDAVLLSSYGEFDWEAPRLVTSTSAVLDIDQQLTVESLSPALISKPPVRQPVVVPSSKLSTESATTPAAPDAPAPRRSPQVDRPASGRSTPEPAAGGAATEPRFVGVVADSVRHSGLVVPVLSISDLGSTTRPDSPKSPTARLGSLEVDASELDVQVSSFGEFGDWNKPMTVAGQRSPRVRRGFDDATPSEETPPTPPQPRVVASSSGSNKTGSSPQLTVEAAGRSTPTPVRPFGAASKAESRPDSRPGSGSGSHPQSNPRTDDDLDAQSAGPLAPTPRSLVAAPKPELRSESRSGSGSHSRSSSRTESDFDPPSGSPMLRSESPVPRPDSPATAHKWGIGTPPQTESPRARTSQASSARREVRHSGGTESESAPARPPATVESAIRSAVVAVPSGGAAAPDDASAGFDYDEALQAFGGSGLSGNPWLRVSIGGSLHDVFREIASPMKAFLESHPNLAVSDDTPVSGPVIPSGEINPSSFSMSIININIHRPKHEEFQAVCARRSLF